MHLLEIGQTPPKPFNSPPMATLLTARMRVERRDFSLRCTLCAFRLQQELIGNKRVEQDQSRYVCCSALSTASARALPIKSCSRILRA